MKKEIITINKLTAGNGMILTDGKSFGSIVYLPSGEAADKWYEITEEEYEEITVRMEAGADG